jgi:hypothetical protein
MRCLFVGAFLISVATVVAIAQESSQSGQAPATQTERTLLSHIKVGDWISFSEAESSFSVTLLERPADVTLDEWYEVHEELLAEQRKARRGREASDPFSEEPAETRERQKAGEEKSREVQARIGRHGQRPYEVLAVHPDHLTVRSERFEFYLAASAIRSITRELPKDR